MNLIEILKAKGLSDELIQEIQADMKANNVYTASEENLDIRYGKLKTQFEGTNQQLTEAYALIEDMKKSTKGQEELQAKIAAHEQREAQILSELEQTKIKSAIKVGLLASKAKDVGYLTYKLEEKMKEEGKSFVLNKNEAIEGWEDMLKGLQTQLPDMFESASDEDGFQVYNPSGLPGSSGGDVTPTKEKFKAMSYEERVALKQKNEQLYKQLAK